MNDAAKCDGRWVTSVDARVLSFVGLVLAVWLLGLGTAAAQERERVVLPSRIESPRGMALGSGARASAASSQAQADNVANLVLGGVYHMESFVGYDPTFKRVGVGASVVDSMTSRLAAGASVRALLGSNDAGENSGWEARVGLAFPLADMISIGIAGRYARMNIADSHAVPESVVPAMMKPDGMLQPELRDQRFRLKKFTMDAALTLRPVQGLSIAALAYNLIDTKSALAPMTVGGSVAFSSSGLTIGADALFDLNKHKQFDGTQPYFGGGLEYLVGGVAPLRAGYAYDKGRETHYVTGGVGYVDNRFGVQISLRQTANGPKETSLFFGVQYFVQ